MRIKVIKNQKEYSDALEYFNFLMDKGEELTEEEEVSLELVSKLIEDYEKDTFAIDLPDPIEAIKFRMEQENLSQADLIPYIGSASKVSEVLSRKRPLSITMIKALKEGLEIPHAVLLNQNRNERIDDSKSLDNYPLQEMLKRAYIFSKKNESKLNLYQKAKEFLSILGSENQLNALFSRTINIRGNRSLNNINLAVWIAQVLYKSDARNLPKYDPNSLNKAFFSELIQLSTKDNFIELVENKLRSIGIDFIIEKHMPKTYLDGAAIMMKDKNPIVALTIRLDRLDNFWFTLVHELSHIKLHYEKDVKVFVDEIQSADLDMFEQEADRFTQDIFVPEREWKDSPANILPSKDTIELLAKELKIHSAIIAGKIRYSRGKYHLFSDMVGSGEVSKNIKN